VLTARDYDYAFFIFMKLKFYKYAEFLTGTAVYISLLLVSSSNSDKVERSNMTNTVNII